MPGRALDGSRVVITGASGGIGGAAMAALRGRGARVQGIDLLPAEGVLAADVRDPGSVRAAIEQAASSLGGIDILVNCAGIGTVQDAGAMPDDDTRRTVEVNFWGAWVTTAAALPHLLDSHGHVVNVTSFLAVASIPFAAAYCASKHALDAYSNSLRIEYFDRLTVSTVRPGYVKTAIHDGPAARGLSLDGMIHEDSLEEAAAAIVRACTHRPRVVATSRRTEVALRVAQHFPAFLERMVIRRGRGRGFELGALAEAPRGD